MNWTIEETDRIEDDLLTETHGDNEIYTVIEPSVLGYGVFTNGVYYVKYFFVNDRTVDELNKLSDDLLIEARQFATGVSPNQLSLSI